MDSFEGIKERWELIPRWQKWFGFAVLLCLIYFLVYVQQVKPRQQKMQVLKKQVEQLTLKVNRLKAVEKRKGALEKEIKELTLKIEALESKLPTGKEEVSKIIKAITKTGSHVRVDYIERKSPVQKQYYVEIPYLLKLSFRYPDFIAWCERLSSVDRIINFSDMTLVSFKGYGRNKGKKKQKLEERQFTVRANLIIKAFNLKR